MTHPLPCRSACGRGRVGCGQPFGGRGLLGNGTKAGGPLYLTQLGGNAQTEAPGGNASDSPVLRDYIDWLAMQSDAVAAAAVKDFARRSRVGEEFEFPDPVGER